MAEIISLHEAKGLLLGRDGCRAEKASTSPGRGVDANHTAEIHQFETDRITARLRGICEAFNASGLGIEWFPFLMHLMFSTNITRRMAAKTFAAARTDVTNAEGNSK